MAKYLDQTGLKYFWGKIKAKMNGPLQAYPVGSVYISISSNFNPNTSFGGTWERFGQGRTLIGEGTGNDGDISMTFTANSTGGEYKHRLKEAEMPKHHHQELLMVKGESSWEKQTVNNFGAMIDYTTKNYVTPKQEVHATSVTAFTYTNWAGDSVEHNNIQPYITVYFWKRIA